VCVCLIYEKEYHTLKSRANEREKKKMIIIKKNAYNNNNNKKRAFFFLPYILIASSSTRMCGICAGNLRPSVRIPARWGRHIKNKKTKNVAVFFFFIFRSILVVVWFILERSQHQPESFVVDIINATPFFFHFLSPGRSGCYWISFLLSSGNELAGTWRTHCQSIPQRM
jgi:hypothetical protein